MGGPDVKLSAGELPRLPRRFETRLLAALRSDSHLSKPLRLSYVARL